MQRLLRVMAGLAGILALAAGAAALYIDRSGIPRYVPARLELSVDVTPERVERGRKSVDMLCAACHLDNETGVLSGHRMPDLPPQFGVAYSANITRDPETGIGAWSDGELAHLLRTGVTRDGRYTPPWMIKLPLMADEDLKDIIAFLRSDDPLVRPVKRKAPPSEPSFFTKVLCRVAFKPLPLPAGPIPLPDANDPVAHGRYLVQGRALCYGCHSLDFAKLDDLEPEKSAGYLGGGNAMPDLTGRVVTTSNLTPDEETGIGKWSEDEFVRALRHGVRPDRSVLVYPMVPYPEFSEAEARAIHAYLRTVPKIRNAVDRTLAPAVPTGDAGKAAYYRYSCHSCHGDTGTLVYDLRKGVANHATDADLIAYIRHPERFKPGVKMPTWDGVIAEEDYAPLAAYVRTLGASRP
jgi:Cytochrome C oxidase, cbb3-type, subunit III/Cytochrome c